TIWETHDWGDGRNQVTTWKGWHNVVGNTSDILLTGDDCFFVPSIATSTVTVKIVIGAIEKKQAIPTGAYRFTFVLIDPTAVTAGILSNGFVLGLRYTRTTTGYTWAWTGLQITCPLTGVSFNANFKFGRFFLAKGVWNPANQAVPPNYGWTPDPDYPEWAVGDTEDGTETISGNVVTTVASPPQPFQGVAGVDPYPTFRITVKAYTILNGDTGLLALAWTGTEPTGAVNASDGRAVYITPDPTKATPPPRTAANAAPNLLAATMVATLLQVNGVPYVGIGGALT